MDNLLEAYSTWLAGEKVCGSTPLIFGWTLLFWVRLSKCMGLVSLLGIAAEVAGPTRVRLFGKRIRDGISAKIVVARAMLSFEFMFYALGIVSLLFASHGFFDKYDGIQTQKMTAGTRRYLLPNTILAIALTTLVFKKTVEEMVKPDFSPISAIFMIFMAFVVSWCIIGPLVIAVTMSTYTLLVLVFDLVILNPIAWCLDRKNPANAIKIGIALILLMAFHFDLLAS